MLESVEQKISTLKAMSLNDFLHTIYVDMLTFGKNLILALIIFFIGKYAIKFLMKGLTRLIEKRKADPTLSTFTLSVLKAVLIAILIVLIISTMGVSTSTFVALFGAAGLAAGLALSGTLQNFAGGIMILMQRPFRVGDFIEAQGQQGTVKMITLFNTIITTVDNKTIYIPNGSLATGILNNYTRAHTRRVEWIFSIGYEDNYDLAKVIIENSLVNDQRIMQRLPIQVALKGLEPNSVDIVARAWVKTDDFWDVFFDINEKIFKDFKQQQITIPRPQMDVHLHRADEKALPEEGEKP